MVCRYFILLLYIWFNLLIYFIFTFLHLRYNTHYWLYMVCLRSSEIARIDIYDIEEDPWEFFWQEKGYFFLLNTSILYNWTNVIWLVRLRIIIWYSAALKIQHYIIYPWVMGSILAYIIFPWEVRFKPIRYLRRPAII